MISLRVPADAAWSGEFDNLTVTAHPNVVVIDGLDRYRPLTAAEARRLTMALIAAADAADEA
jgi:hypothetical protein